MNKAKKLIGFAFLSCLAILGSKYAPNSSTAFFLITLGIAALMCIPIFEIEAYINRNRNENK